MKAALPLALAALLVMAGPALANPIERACNQSDRAAASHRLCACIGAAADATLSRSEMRTGARFFRDPARAQSIQLSDTPANERFWDNWRAFAERAERMCT